MTRKVCRHDVVVAVGSSDGDGVGARPRLGVGFAIEFLDADKLEDRRPLDGSQPVGEGGEAVEVVRQVVIDDRCCCGWRQVHHAPHHIGYVVPARRCPIHDDGCRCGVEDLGGRGDRGGLAGQPPRRGDGDAPSGWSLIAPDGWSTPVSGPEPGLLQRGDEHELLQSREFGVILRIPGGRRPCW